MSMSIKERFNLLLKKGEEESTTFDESDFNFKIFGGPSQADLIRVEAHLINPEKFGNKGIELNCKWFNKTQKDLIEIQGTAGQSYYQPSLKDIGTTIRIECFPEMTGKSYEGMPITRDIGPLIMEKETEEDAHEFVESGSATLLVRVTRSHNSTHYSETDGLIKVTSNQISIKTKQGEDFLPLISGQFSERFPSYQADNKNQKLLKILFSETEFVEVLVQQSRMRDVLVLASKMLAGKRIMDLNELNEQKEEKEQEKIQQQIQDNKIQTEASSPLKRAPEQSSPTRKKQKASGKDLIQIAQLTKQCKQLSILNQSLKKQLQQSKSKESEFLGKYKVSEQRLENLSKNYFVIQKELEEIKNRTSTEDDKFVFVNNEIRVLKEQNQGLKKQLAGTNENLLLAQAELKGYSSTEDNRPKYDQLYDLYIKYKNQSEVLHQRLGYMESQATKYEQIIHFQKQNNEELVYNLQRLNSKNESLLRESKIPMVSEEKTHKSMEHPREEEIMRLKRQIKNLVDQNDELRKRNTKSPEKSQSKNPKKAQLKQLHKLANRLSEAVTEKDQIISDMREVNKQMVARMRALQDAQKKDQAPN